MAEEVIGKMDEQALRNIWLSTSGDGVPWLHVRVSDVPKRYRHSEYTALPGVKRKVLNNITSIKETFKKNT